MELDEKLAKAKAEIKLTQVQEGLEGNVQRQRNALNPGLNSGNQVEFTEDLIFRIKTANSMHSIEQTMIVLQLCDKAVRE